MRYRKELLSQSIDIALNLELEYEYVDYIFYELLDAFKLGLDHGEKLQQMLIGELDENARF